MINKSQSLVEPEAFAEIIESSIDQAFAQCWSNEKIPDFASLVRIKNLWGDSFGCVTEIKSESTIPGARPVAYGLGPERLKIEQPQVFKLIKTTFKFVVVSPVSRPSDIHTNVFFLSDDEFIEQVGKPMFFSNLISQVNDSKMSDKILVYLIKRIKVLGGLNDSFWADFFDQYRVVPESRIDDFRLILRKIK